MAQLTLTLLFLGGLDDNASAFFLSFEKKELNISFLNNLSFLFSNVLKQEEPSPFTLKGKIVIKKVQRYKMAYFIGSFTLQG